MADKAVGGAGGNFTGGGAGEEVSRKYVGGVARRDGMNEGM